jgi:hypothetical protein
VPSQQHTEARLTAPSLLAYRTQIFQTEQIFVVTESPLHTLGVATSKVHTIIITAARIASHSSGVYREVMRRRPADRRRRPPPLDPHQHYALQLRIVHVGGFAVRYATGTTVYAYCLNSLFLNSFVQLPFLLRRSIFYCTHSRLG